MQSHIITSNNTTLSDILLLNSYYLSDYKMYHPFSMLQDSLQCNILDNLFDSNTIANHSENFTQNLTSFVNKYSYENMTIKTYNELTID